MRKYFYITLTSVKSNIIYIKDFIISNIFLFFMVIIYIFLWKNVFSTSIQTGYSFPEIIWYLIINQFIFIGNGPLYRQVRSDIKTGDVIYYLNKPYSYPIYLFFSYLGRNLIICTTNAFFGILIGLVLIGPIESFKSSINIFLMLIMILLGISLNILIYILLSLISFWVEENQTFVSLYQQVVFIFGGFLIPLTFFPTFIQNIIMYMPWAYISFHISNTCVKFTISSFLNTIVSQIIYIIIFSLLISKTFKNGRAKLDVNGG